MSSSLRTGPPGYWLLIEQTGLEGNRASDIFYFNILSISSAVFSCLLVNNDTT